jgi:hypothetical protein
MYGCKKAGRLRDFVHPFPDVCICTSAGNGIYFSNGTSTLPMKHRFNKHYTRDEARALLPQIRTWLERLAQLRHVLDRLEKRLETLMKQGRDAGGQTVNEQVRTLADLQEILAEFQRRQIFIKDLERGLVDFPAIIGGKEVFRCWEQDEEDVEFWHDLESGYGGRERL